MYFFPIVSWIEIRASLFILGFHGIISCAALDYESKACKKNTFLP